MLWRRRKMSDIKGTNLWKIFEKKATEEGYSHGFIDEVQKMCERGANISKTVIVFFPTFTLHDETHLRNVSEWMLRLLGSYTEKLTAIDAAYLLLSAWCHDLGMAVTQEEKSILLQGIPKNDWNKYFASHFDAKMEYDTNGIISDETLRDYVRTFHSSRAGEKLRKDWPSLLTLEGHIMPEYLISLCNSHGIDGRKIAHISPGDNNFLRYAVLLRIADLLDYDASRAPADLISSLGLDSPTNAEFRISRMEWDKNRSGGFKGIENDAIQYYVVSDSLQLEKEIQNYLDYVQDELVLCNQLLTTQNGKWECFSLPNRIEVNIHRNGYKYGEFRITMDQDRVLELLTGRNLYKNAGVFVRELLQNSIDAVLTRRSADYDFRARNVNDGIIEAENVGKIRIDTWNENGFDWFRIEDDGIGMTENIITNHFLKVGRSYYESDEFRKDLYLRKPYTPISRFGIGILSCFMADPENTLIEVSTKRYSRTGEYLPAIRFDVEGIHGYYYLTTDETRGYHVKPLHHPINEDKILTFRSEPGTTICVRTKLRQLGNYSSFQKILDEYILYPEVKIEHYAWESDGTVNRKTYITQQEFSQMVHAKNPGGISAPIKEHQYPFSDAIYAKIQEKTPGVTWVKRPTLVFQFYPLDWLDDETGNLHGVVVMAHIQLSAYSKSFCLDGEEIMLHLNAVFNNDDDMSHSKSLRSPTIKINHIFPSEVIHRMEALQHDINILNTPDNEIYAAFIREYPIMKDDSSWNDRMEKELKLNRVQFRDTFSYWEEKERDALAQKNKYWETLEEYKSLRAGINISISDFFWECIYSDPFLRLFSPLRQEFTEMCMQFRKTIPMLSSCNGIAIPNCFRLERNTWHSERQKYLGCFALALYSGSYRPELVLSRDTITSVSTEAYYSHEHIARALPVKFTINHNYSRTQSRLISEHDYKKMLKRHSSWNKLLYCTCILDEESILGGEKAYSCKTYSLPELEEFLKSRRVPVLVNSRDDFRPITLLALKERFKVCREFNPRGFLHITEGKTDNTTLNFPPNMFYEPTVPCSSIGYVKLHGDNYFNLEHRFSKWLIKNWETMEQNRLSASISHNLLAKMLNERSKTGLIEAINSSLDELRKLKNNPFHVTEELYVFASDILEDSDFNGFEVLHNFVFNS